MTSIKLKPCPFCGEKAVPVDEFKERKWVACLSEHCKVKPHTEGFRTLSEAVSAWNQRKAK